MATNAFQSAWVCFMMTYNILLANKTPHPKNCQLLRLRYVYNLLKFIFQNIFFLWFIFQKIKDWFLCRVALLLSQLTRKFILSFLYQICKITWVALQVHYLISCTLNFFQTRYEPLYTCFFQSLKKWYLNQKFINFYLITLFYSLKSLIETFPIKCCKNTARITKNCRIPLIFNWH